jgi:predicted metal-dependent hydrolase
MLLFEIIRSNRRKQVAIRVREGKVEILAPPHLSESDAKTFLDKHIAWVHKQLHKQVSPPYHHKQYSDGEIFPYLGEDYVLQVAYAKKPALMVRENQLYVFIRATDNAQQRKKQIYQQLRCWYWEQAEKVLREKSHHYAQQLQVHYQSVNIRQFKSCWGNCSIKGNIQYNWQIILAPHPIIDYLVVHELAHLAHHNHSSRFWQLVESMIPDYKERRKWLRMHGHLLRID